MKYDLTVDEQVEVETFLQERHQSEEWDAFFAFYALSRWKRNGLRLVSSLLRLLLI